MWGVVVAAALTAVLAIVVIYRYGGEIQFRMRMIKQFVGAPAEAEAPAGDAPDPSIMDGSAWDDFCDAIKVASKSVLDSRAPRDEATRAEGFRYLTSLLASGLTMYMFSDPDRPRFVRPLDWNVKWGLDNSDALYLVTAINPEGEYVIRGTRGTVGFFDLQTSCGRFGSNRPMKVLSSINGVDLDVNPDGTFEIVVSQKPHEGNWLPLTPEANQIGVRQFFVDWDHEKAPELRIERTDRELEPPVPSSHEIAKRLRRVSGFVAGSANLWLEFVLGRRPLHLNELSEPAGASELQGSNAQVYGSCYFKLEPDAALLIEVVPPEAARARRGALDRGRPSRSRLLEFRVGRLLVSVARLREPRHQHQQAPSEDRQRRGASRGGLGERPRARQLVGHGGLARRDHDLPVGAGENLPAPFDEKDPIGRAAGSRSRRRGVRHG